MNKFEIKVTDYITIGYLLNNKETIYNTKKMLQILK